MLRKITYHHFLIAAKFSILGICFPFLSMTCLAFRMGFKNNYLRWLRRLAWCTSFITGTLESFSSFEFLKLLPLRGKLLIYRYGCFKRLYTKLTKRSNCFDNSRFVLYEGIFLIFLVTCIVSNCWISVNRGRHLNLSEYAAVYTTLKSSLKRRKFNLNWIAIEEVLNFIRPRQSVSLLP